MRLIVVRHGQTDWNVAGRAQGHTDIPLNAEGLRQAEALGAVLRGLRFERVLSSDLARAVQTLRIAGHEPEVRPDLRERSFGAFEGKSFEQVHAWLETETMRQGCEREDVCPPEGESFRDVWHRLDPIVLQLTAGEGDTLLATHGGTASLLLAKLLDLPIEANRRFRFENARLTVFERAHGAGFRLRAHNVPPVAGIL